MSDDKTVTPIVEELRRIERMAAQVEHERDERHARMFMTLRGDQSAPASAH